MSAIASPAQLSRAVSLYGRLQALRAAWDESKHPRGHGGRFTTGGEGRDSWGNPGYKSRSAERRAQRREDDRTSGMAAIGGFISGKDGHMTSKLPDNRGALEHAAAQLRKNHIPLWEARGKGDADDAKVAARFRHGLKRIEAKLHEMDAGKRYKERYGGGGGGGGGGGHPSANRRAERRSRALSEARAIGHDTTTGSLNWHINNPAERLPSSPKAIRRLASQIDGIYKSKTDKKYDEAAQANLRKLDRRIQATMWKWRSKVHEHM